MTMNALLKKDWRVFRGPLYGGLAILATPYLIAAVSVLFYPNPWVREENLGRFLAAAMTDLWLIGLIAAVFGGAAFASERRERSADFLATLPVSRAQILSSKLLVSISSLVVMWVINLAVVVAIVYQSLGPYGPRTFRINDLGGTIILFATSQIMVFGLGWLLSTFLSSPVLAVSIAIGFTAASIVMITEIFETRLEHPETPMKWFIFYWTLAWGFLSLLIGSLYYLRRVEP